MKVALNGGQRFDYLTRLHTTNANVPSRVG